MAEKAEKEVEKKTAETKLKEPKVTGKKISELLLENSIALQKTLTALAADLKELNKKISSLLELFETASKAIKEKPKASELLEKIDTLIKQNKTIAKGLLLLERAMRESAAKETVSVSKPLPEI